jgi:hypothetical protein
MHEMNGMFLRPEQINKILTKDLGTAYEGDTLDLINGQYDFDMLAGARMQARSAQRQSLPMLFQFLLTDPVMSGLQDTGEKINMAELVKMTFDVSGWPNQSSLIVPLTQEDQQRIQAKSPQMQQQAQLQHQQQMEQVKTNNKSQLLEQETEAKAGQLVIKHELVKNDRSSFGLSD